MTSQEQFTERLTVYVTASLRNQIAQARQEAGLSQPDWIRRVLEAAAAEQEEGQGEDPSVAEVDPGPLSSELAASHARVEGLEAIVDMLRERLGHADAQNIELNQRLEEAHRLATSLTPALPPPGETSAGGGFRWRFWR